MSDWLIYAIGFVAQLLFSGRMLLQWVVSEKNKRIITPAIFWHLSLLASFLLFIYGYLRDDFAIMLGQALTYYIYIRNLQLQGKWNMFPRALQLFVWIFPLLIVVIGFNNNQLDTARLFKNENIPFWLLSLGIVSQVIFNIRFVYQWFRSEKKKTSVLPKGFWVMSLIGSGLILIYGVIREDPVLLAGHGIGFVMYIRNLYIQKNETEG